MATVSENTIGDGRLVKDVTAENRTTSNDTMSIRTHIQQVINRSRQEGDFGEDVIGIGAIEEVQQGSLDLTDYKPVQAFPLNHSPITVTTINHDLAKNIVAIQFETRISICKLVKNKSDGKEFFTLTKIQEFRTSHPDHSATVSIAAFSINPVSNVSDFGDRRLVYGLCMEDDSKIYLVSEVKKGRDAFSQLQVVDSEDVHILDSNTQGGSVRHLSFDADRGDLLGTLFDSPFCVVWDVGSREVVARFTLKSPGVSCLWHKSEPFKLLVIEQAGVIRLYNTAKQSTIFTVNTLLQPIFSAEWSPSNPKLVGIGANKCAYIYDLTVLNSAAGGKRLEAHMGPTHSIKFSTTEKPQLATMSMAPRPEIRTYQHNFKNSVWTSKQESLQSIAWIYGEPFLLALSGKQLIIYKSQSV